MLPTRDELIRDLTVCESEERRIAAYLKSLRVADVRWDCPFCDDEDVKVRADDECPVCPTCKERLWATPIDIHGNEVK